VSFPESISVSSQIPNTPTSTPLDETTTKMIRKPDHQFPAYRISSTSEAHLLMVSKQVDCIRKLCASFSSR
jgi:hypothetical protein